MELQCHNCPDFYKTYDWLVEQEDNRAYFCGRKHYLKSFWLELCNVAGKGSSRNNKTFIGQRKLGKTAYLIRCYNVAFWEQDEVIPFYYCFPQGEEMDLRNTAKKIAFIFLKQAVAFVTKNKNFSNTKSEKIFFSRLKKKKFKWFEDLEIYWEETKENIATKAPELVLREAWSIVDAFYNLFDKKCVLIIDEYQETLQSLLHEGKTIKSHESIIETVNNYNILTFISGSQISMLANEVLTSKLNNRIPGETFFPLEEKEAHELILRYAGKDGYKGIEKDIFNMVGGNPYYIKMFFATTNYYQREYKSSKKWKCFQDVDNAYTFEVLNFNGAIFSFWEKHINEKYDLLNGDLPKHKGTTIKILKYIAEKEREVDLDELRSKFPHVKNMREKMENLRKADLIRTSRQSEQVFNFSDVVLPVVLTKMHQKLLLGSSSKKELNKYRKKWFKTMEYRIARIEGDLDKNKDNIHELRENDKEAKEKQVKIQKDVAKIKANVSDYFVKKEKNKASKIGKASLEKGMRAESKFQKNIAKYIKKQKGIFKNYKLVGSLQDINIKLTSGQGAQIDLFGELQSLNNAKPKKYFIVGEMKDRRNKVTAKEAQKFQDKINLAQILHKSQNIVGIFICTGGFWKTATTVLDKKGIIHGTSDNIIQSM